MARQSTLRPITITTGIFCRLNIDVSLEKKGTLGSSYWLDDMGLVNNDRERGYKMGKLLVRNLLRFLKCQALKQPLSNNSHLCMAKHFPLLNLLDDRFLVFLSTVLLLV